VNIEQSEQEKAAGNREFRKRPSERNLRAFPQRN
jgi:hypothetical protein